MQEHIYLQRRPENLSSFLESLGFKQRERALWRTPDSSMDIRELIINRPEEKYHHLWIVPSGTLIDPNQVSDVKRKIEEAYSDLLYERG